MIKINYFIQEFSEDATEQDAYYDEEQEYDDVEDIEIDRQQFFWCLHFIQYCTLINVNTVCAHTLYFFQ